MLDFRANFDYDISMFRKRVFYFQQNRESLIVSARLNNDVLETIGDSLFLLERLRKIDMNEKFDGIEVGEVKPYPERTYFTHQSCIICPGCGKVLTFEPDEKDDFILELLRSINWKKSQLTNKWYCYQCQNGSDNNADDPLDTPYDYGYDGDG